MIATLEGIVSETIDDQIVIDVQGVGYGIFMPLSAQAGAAQGEQIKLYIYEHIREVGHDLFGFTDLNDKQLFEQLLTVTGVGSKMALSLLNIGSSSQVRRAIASGDTKFVQQANGVGKRVAERVVVELKDKVGLVSADLTGSSFFVGDTVLQSDEAVQALVSLGYSPQDASKALDNVDTKLSTEERVKLALKERA